VRRRRLAARLRQAGFTLITGSGSQSEVAVQAERSEFIARAWTATSDWRIQDREGEAGAARGASRLRRVFAFFRPRAALCPASIRTQSGRCAAPCM
jgi:hypothetical protein